MNRFGDTAISLASAHPSLDPSLCAPELQCSVRDFEKISMEVFLDEYA